MYPNSRSRRVVAIASFFILTAFTQLAKAEVPPPQSARVSVSANHLVRDGVIWTPHGLVTIAYVAPPAAQQGVFLTAYQHATPEQLLAIKAWGADTIRMQVSQPGLDPEGPLFTQKFLDSVRGEVVAVRESGLNVILSLQDELQSGEKSPVALPDVATTRVWKELAPLFNGDTGILYEILNEPKPMPNPANWDAWARSMNGVISAIRSTGSKNVVVADGLNYAETFKGAPLLKDPDHQVAYASHPYFHNAFDQTEPAWTMKFGKLAETVPVIITEWTTSDKGNFYCDNDTAMAALRLLAYLKTRNIGLAGFAYDFGRPLFGSVVVDYKGTPSTYAGRIGCRVVNYGPGTLIQHWYRTGAVPTVLE